MFVSGTTAQWVEIDNEVHSLWIRFTQETIIRKRYNSSPVAWKLVVTQLRALMHLGGPSGESFVAELAVGTPYGADADKCVKTITFVISFREVDCALCRS